MTTPPIFIVSGGKGSSGEQLVRTVLAQFPEKTIPIIVVPQVRQPDQIQDVVDRAVTSGGTIVHTLVDSTLRGTLTNLAREKNITAIDLMGSLLLRLSSVLEQPPLGQPGLYRELREDYFKRIEAIEFTVDHDDGRRPHELRLAEIVLIGVSRVGKTPLSMYLSTRGWKVANVPLIKEVPVPPELFAIDNRRVVGLLVEPDQLMSYRQHRQQRLGVGSKSAYADIEALATEVDFARQIFRRGQFATVDVTDKSIEESAEEVIARITRQLREP